jgi:hypothetical protein
VQRSRAKISQSTERVKKKLSFFLMHRSGTLCDEQIALYRTDKRSVAVAVLVRSGQSNKKDSFSGTGKVS